MVTTPPEALPPPAPGRRRSLLLLAGTLVIALALTAGGAAYAFAGDVPRGTTVLGIDVGALSREEAVRTLRDGLAGRPEVTAAVPVRIGDQEVPVQPADVGLAVDVDATVAAAAQGRSRLWGSREVDPVVTVDAERLATALRKPASKAAQAMTKPAVTFDGLTPKPVYGAPGKALDRDRSAQALREGWLRVEPVHVPLVDLHPATTREEVDALVTELARPAVAAPVTLTTPRGPVTVPPAAIATALTLTGDAEGRITPKIDGKKLRAALRTALTKVETAPKEATVVLNGGTPRVVAGADGAQVDFAKLGTDLLAVLRQPAPRSVAATMTTVAPKNTTQEMAKLGIKERVSTFTTQFTGGLSLGRSKNIIQAAKEVDGAILKPGETFSLNGHTGPRGYAEGYVDAPVILNGKLVPGVGGGISQFTTTLFNAAYYAGLQDVEHTPHSYYFNRYPSVIESTIFYPTLDMKFRNNTKYGVLIDTSYTSGSITVSMWSTRIYDSVKTEWSAKRDIVEPRTVQLPAGPSCIATEGIQGFTQDAWRIFRQGGKEIRREKFTWHYDAEPRFVCGKLP